MKRGASLTRFAVPMRTLSAPSAIEGIAATAVPSRNLERESCMSLPQSEPLEPRQHFISKKRKLIVVVDERKRETRKSGRAHPRHLVRNEIGIAHHAVTAVPCRVSSTNGLNLLGRSIAQRMVVAHRHREMVVDGAPIAVLVDDVVQVVVGLFLRRAAYHVARRVDTDL